MKELNIFWRLAFFSVLVNLALTYSWVWLLVAAACASNVSTFTVDRQKR